MTASVLAPNIATPHGLDAVHFKDAVLDDLAEHGNVAQFVSFGPTREQRFARVAGFDRGHRFASVADAAGALLARATDRSVNVRSFVPESPKSREFIYGLTSAADVAAAVERLGRQGLYTIINETVDVNDGGVSGVALGDVVEFAPGDTPRAVEKPGTAALPRALGLTLLETVYGFAPDLNYSPETRVEFSIHPLRRGTRQGHTIIWELEDVGPSHTAAALQWPNRFSQFIGDKAFGLLVAHLLGLPVPAATLLARTVAPFTFGRPTGSAERWLRTCPRVQTPGKYTTRRGWTDPYALLQAEDPDGTAIASVLAQAGVEAEYSGAALVAHADHDATGAAGDEGAGGYAYTRPLEIADMPWAAGRTGRGAYTLTIEGTAGFGDRFMVGETARTALPAAVVDAVAALYQQATAVLGPVRLEWVADTHAVWVVQCHRGATETTGRVIVPGAPVRYRDFDVSAGLEALRALVAEVAGTDEGIALLGDVGVTSHFGDVLRKARVPSVIVPAPGGLVG